MNKKDAVERLIEVGPRHEVKTGYLASICVQRLFDACFGGYERFDYGVAYLSSVFRGLERINESEEDGTLERLGIALASAAFLYATKTIEFYGAYEHEHPPRRS